MSEKIAKWIIEYLLRKKIDENIINGVISSLPPIINDYRIKKTMLLRGIETEISTGCISDKILELIEIIDTIDSKKGVKPSQLMKEAYCLVAVDCTVRFLSENDEEMEKYEEMIEIVWRNRVLKSERLVSEMMREWWSDIESAVSDDGVYGKIWKRNTRNEALKTVRDYLREEWKCLGPCLIELVAGEGETETGNYRRELVAVEEATQKSSPVTRRKPAAVKSRRNKGVKILVADEDAMNEDGDDTSKTVQLREATAKVDSAKEVTCVQNDHLSVDNQTAQTLSSTGPKVSSSFVGPDNNRQEILKSCEVVKVRKALKKNTKKLNAAVSDPLPEALRTAQTIVASLAKSSVLPTIPEPDWVQNVDTRNDVGGSKQAETEINAPQGEIENDLEKLNQDVVNEDSRGHATLSNGVEKNVRKRSLMEINGTSHNYQWDDETENSSLGSPSRSILPSPKPLNSCAPLQIPEYRSYQKRRVRKRWIPLEEDALREGVEKYGRGSWKTILNDVKFCEIFQGRTEVDLKDKWRNMTRFGRGEDLISQTVYIHHDV